MPTVVRVHDEMVEYRVPPSVSFMVYETAHFPGPSPSERLNPMPVTVTWIPGVPLLGVACTVGPLTILNVPVAFSFCQLPVAFILTVFPAPAINVNCPVNSPALIEQDGAVAKSGMKGDPPAVAFLKSQNVDDAL
jgi:hypothetical protein